jgi:small conductance mechanosensitive channel
MQTIFPRLQAALNRIAATFTARTPDLILALVVLGLFLLLALAATRLLRRALRHTHLPPETERGLERIVFFGLLFLGVFAVLNELDISLGALGIEVSLLGVAVGFGLKELLTNLVAGLMILTSRPFGIGDQIRIKEFEGTVAAIGFRGTTLITYDGRHVILPNLDLLTNPVINNTASPLRRHSIVLGVSSGADLSQVRRLILEALAQMPDVADDPAVPSSSPEIIHSLKCLTAETLDRQTGPM